MTISESDLSATEARANAAAPGPWYPIATDDELFQGAAEMKKPPSPGAPSEICAYQLAFFTPGSSPLCAISRMQMRHMPKKR